MGFHFPALIVLFGLLLRRLFMREAQMGGVRFWLVCLVLAGGSSGCVLKEPLSNPDEAKPDERLFGAWRFEGQDKKPREYWVIFIGKSELPGTPPGVLKTVQVDGEEKIEVRSGYFFTTSLGTENYANILNENVSEKDKRQRWDKTPADGWLLVRYAVA